MEQNLLPILRRDALSMYRKNFTWWAMPTLLLAITGQMIMALSMGFANAAVFKLVPKYSPAAVGGAAGIVGGLGAFGGFVIPPLMGLFVKVSGRAGYARGFAIFLVLALVCMALFAILHHYAPASRETATEKK
jgi:nitrate/nitrite transporter NarK